MAGRGEKPVKKPGTKSRASKKKKVERLKEADERARRRFALVQYVRRAQKADPDASILDVWSRLVAEFKEGKFRYDPGSRAGLYNLLKRADQHGESAGIEAFRDEERTGRPKKTWDATVQDQADRLIRAGVHASTTPLLRDLCEFAERRGLESPTEWQVRTLLETYDLAVLSAGAHGRRSAIADALPHPTIPVDFTHQVWTLDEALLPVWIRALHPQHRVWVSLRPWCIFIADNASRALLAALLVEPFKFGRTNTAYDGEDITAAFLSAALADLATPGSEAFVGYLPHTLRWDRSQTHKPLAARIGDDLLHIPLLPGLKPQSRGSIERLIGSLKDFLAGADGHIDQWVPEDQEAADQRQIRTKAAAGPVRHRRRVTYRVAELPTFEEFAADFYDRVRRYNTFHVNRMIGVAPEVEYRRLLQPDKLRSGFDALQLLERTVLTVGKGGVEWRNRRFAAYVGARRLGVGERVVCRPDPAGRGLFIEHNGVPAMLLPVDKWSRLYSPEQVARMQAEEVAEISEDADVALREIQQEQIARRKRRGTRKATADRPAAAEQVQAPEQVEVQEEAPVPERDIAVGAEELQLPPAPAARPKAKKPAPQPAADEADTAPRLPRGVVKSRRSHLRLVD